jgi:hypothetical protein
MHSHNPGHASCLLRPWHHMLRLHSRTVTEPKCLLHTESWPMCIAQVKFIRLRQAAQPWMQPSCPLTSLTSVGHGLLMATFSDNSIRLVRNCKEDAAPHVCFCAYNGINSQEVVRSMIAGLGMLLPCCARLSCTCTATLVRGLAGARLATTVWSLCTCVACSPRTPCCCAAAAAAAAVAAILLSAAA